MNARRNHNPVSFPAGSFDRQALQTGLDKAAGAEPEKRAAAVTDAVQAAAGETGLSVIDGATRADQKVVERIHPDLGITEKVRVHDADSEAAKTMAAQADASAERLDRQAQARAERAGAADEPALDETPAPEPDKAKAPAKGDDTK